MGSAMSQLFCRVLCASLLVALTLSASAENSKSNAAAKPAPSAPRTGSLREENITDSEVREIQKIISDRTPGTILSIGAVTNGCTCELAACTNEVVVMVDGIKPAGTVKLARVKGT